MQESRGLRKTYGLLAGLDIGTEKICCTVGGLEYEFHEKDSSWEPKFSVLGFGQSASKGVSYQGITNAEALEDTIMHVVYTAEESAQKNIKEVYVNVPTNLIKTHKIQVNLSLSGQTPIQSVHLRKLFSISRRIPEAESQHIVHLWPLSYTLDDIEGIIDPIGLIGKELSAVCYLVTTSKTYATNITNCIGRCNLNVVGFVTDMYADGLACLVDDEADLGATLIDIGGKITQIACFVRGNLVWMDYVPLGGFHITADLARVLATPISQAERMKILYGSLLESNRDSSEQVPFSQLVDKHSPVVEHVPRKIILEIIKARVDDLFDNILASVQKMPPGVDRVVLQKVVFTGGTSCLHGFAEFAEAKLGTNVRVISSHDIIGVGNLLHSPSFSTCAGLLHYAVQDHIGSNRRNDKKPLNFWQKISLWLNDHI
ncbi:MAG: cell division protein FtsA [Holosporales bacterium]|jgi:cell division protein FtsA|nr:cell division protein FtsA [Holosporales bacterium]